MGTKALYTESTKSKCFGGNSFDNRINGPSHVQFVQDYLVPKLVNLYPIKGNAVNPVENLWYHQDAKSPYYAVDAHRYLDQIFPNTWIERSGTMTIKVSETHTGRFIFMDSSI